MNQRIRRVAPNGTITTFAGTGTFGSEGDGGLASAASLAAPQGIAFDAVGNLYIQEGGLQRHVRRITPDGVIHLFAGGRDLSETRSSVAALLDTPKQVAIDNAGNLYIADSLNHVVRQVSPDGRERTAVGDGAPSGQFFIGDGGPAMAAHLRLPSGVALDSAGGLLITDSGTIRRVGSDGIISTIAGTNQGAPQIQDGPALSRFIPAESLAPSSSGDLYFIDDYFIDSSTPRRVRKLTPDGMVVTVAADASLPSGLSTDGSGNLYVADSGSNRVRRVSPDGTSSTFAGDGADIDGGDGNPALMSEISHPNAVANDLAGNLYIASSNGRVRLVTPDGLMHTIAGLGTDPYGIDTFSGDGGLALAARVNPSNLATDTSGNVYVTDGDRIRRLTPSHVVYYANLDNSLEGGSGATGVGTFVLNDAHTQVVATLTHNVSSPTAAHIHLGVPGSGGPILFTFGAATSSLAAIWNLRAADVADFLAGKLYVDVHSAAFPDGDIGGQIVPLPRVYVTNNGANTVSVVNRNNNTVIDSIPVGKSPYGVTATADGRVYVADFGESSVSVIDSTTDQVARTITVGMNPVAIAATPNGSTVYVTNNGSSTLSVIDGLTGTVKASVTVGFYPIGVALSPNGSRVYVANQGSQSVSVIDTSKNAVIATVGLADKPWGLAMAPDGSNLYVTMDSGEVARIVTATNTGADSIGVGLHAVGIAITPDGTTVLVASNIATNAISVIDTGTNSVVKTISLDGGNPQMISITPDGSRAYVSSSNAARVWAIDIASRKIVGTVNVEGQANGVAVAP